MTQQWKPIESAPKTGRTLLLGYWNSRGNWRTVRGQWMSAAYIAEFWEEPDDVEEGWFETSAEADDAPNCWPVTPSHWMPTPAAPCATCNDQGAVGNILTAEPCPDCTPPASAQDDAKDERQPLFWYRPRSDDGYEGPIHNDRIEDVRKQSGAWVPLYPGFATLPKPLNDLRYHGEFIRGWNQCLREVSSSAPAPAAGDARDSLVNKLAGMVYQYAVTLDQATRDADSDELEAIARRVTGKLKDEIRAALAASQQQEG